VQSGLKTPFFLTRVSLETSGDLFPIKGPGFNDFFSSKSFSSSKGLKIPFVSEVFIVFLLKALQQTTIQLREAKIIPAPRKETFLSGMLLANSSFELGQEGRFIY